MNIAGNIERAGPGVNKQGRRGSPLVKQEVPAMINNG